MFQNAHAIIEGMWLTLGAVWLITAFQLKPNVRSGDAAARLLELLLLLSAAALMFADLPLVPLLEARYAPASATVTALGVAFTAAGVGFAIEARTYLGQNWSATARIKRDHELVRRGPYSLVRHPIYTGIFFAALGTAIAFGQWRHLAALPLVLAGFWVKARSEERLLLGEFGELYLTYCREVRSAIIPYLF